jgi:hypothetical protein
MIWECTICDILEKSSKFWLVIMTVEPSEYIMDSDKVGTVGE